jgi:predicted lipid carrier protein YhbT
MEGSLTTECPGSILTLSIREEIAEGRLNFIGGRWVRQTVKDD